MTTIEQRRKMDEIMNEKRKHNEIWAAELKMLGMTNAEIGKVLGLSEAIVRTYLLKPRYTTSKYATTD